MEKQPTGQDKMRAALTLIATIGVIVFNGLASAGYINGVTPDVISARHPTVLTPAGYAFSIWSLIYVGLLAFSIYQLLPRNLVRFRSIRSLYVITCALNCLWIYFWHQDAVGVCLGVILALLFSLIVLLVQFRRTADLGGAVFTKGVFGLYAGWVTAASLINLLIVIGASGTDLSQAAWNAAGVLALLSAAALAVVVRFKLGNYIYPLAIAWAATAIAVKQSGNTIIVIACSICVIVGLVMAVSFVMDRKGSLET